MLKSYLDSIPDQFFSQKNAMTKKHIGTVTSFKKIDCFPQQKRGSINKNYLNGYNCPMKFPVDA